jgi:hypothetical protein
MQRLVPRYGLKKSTMNGGEGSSTDTTVERALQHYLVGSALEEALEADANDVEIFWPFRSKNEEVASEGGLEELKRRRIEREGDKVDWRGREAIL